MSVDPSVVLAGVGTVLAGLTVTDGAITIGTVDDNADEVLTPYRTHVVPIANRSDRSGGAAKCQSVLTIDVVTHAPRTPAWIDKLLDATVTIDTALRELIARLVALSPSITDANTATVETGAELSYGDVATATWRVSIKYRRE